MPGGSRRENGAIRIRQSRPRHLYSSYTQYDFHFRDRKTNKHMAFFPKSRNTWRYYLSSDERYSSLQGYPMDLIVRPLVAFRGDSLKPLGDWGPTPGQITSPIVVTIDLFPEEEDDERGQD